MMSAMMPIPATTYGCVAELMSPSRTVSGTVLLFALPPFSSCAMKMTFSVPAHPGSGVRMACPSMMSIVMCSVAVAVNVSSSLSGSLK